MSTNSAQWNRELESHLTNRVIIKIETVKHTLLVCFESPSRHRDFRFFVDPENIIKFLVQMLLNLLMTIHVRNNTTVVTYMRCCRILSDLRIGCPYYIWIGPPKRTFVLTFSLLSFHNICARWDNSALKTILCRRKGIGRYFLEHHITLVRASSRILLFSRSETRSCIDLGSILRFIIRAPRTCGIRIPYGCSSVDLEVYLILKFIIVFMLGQSLRNFHQFLLDDSWALLVIKTQTISIRIQGLYLIKPLTLFRLCIHRHTSLVSTILFYFINLMHTKCLSLYITPGPHQRVENVAPGIGSLRAWTVIRKVRHGRRFDQMLHHRQCFFFICPDFERVLKLSRADVFEAHVWISGILKLVHI